MFSVQRCVMKHRGDLDGHLCTVDLENQKGLEELDLIGEVVELLVWVFHGFQPISRGNPEDLDSQKSDTKLPKKRVFFEGVRGSMGDWKDTLFVWQGKFLQFSAKKDETKKEEDCAPALRNFCFHGVWEGVDAPSATTATAQSFSVLDVLQASPKQFENFGWIW